VTPFVRIAAQIDGGASLTRAPARQGRR